MLAGQVLAKISADTSGLRKGVQESQTLLRSLSSSAQSASKGTASGFNSMEKSMAALNKTAASARSTFIGFAAATGVMNFVGRAVGAAKSALVDFNSTVEQAQIGFTTMLGSAKKASAYLDGMMEFAAKTPFQFTELIGASQRLLALGFSANKITPTLKAVGDTVAALGGTMDYQGQIIIRALGQMQAKGKVSAEEMMQLSEAGISAWQYLADGYNVTTAEMMDKTKKTVVDSGTAVQMILDGMAGDFGGMMDAQSKTMQGAFSTVLDYAQQTVGRATMPIYEKLRDGFLKLADVMSGRQFRESSANLSKIIAGGMDKVFAVLGKMAGAVRPVIEGMFSAFSENRGALSSLGSDLMALFEQLVQGATVALKFSASLAQLAPPVALTALKLATVALTELTSVINDNQGVIKIFLGLMVAKRLMEWASMTQKYVVGLYSEAKAHIAAATAVGSQTVAMNGLATATQRANAAASIGFSGGIVPGLDAVNARIAAASTNMTKMQKMTGFLSKGVAGLASVLSPANTAIAMIGLGMAAWATNTQTVTEYTGKMVSSVTDGIEGLTAQYNALGEAQRNSMPSNNDIRYSGGFMSDIGATLKDLSTPFSDNNEDSSTIAAQAFADAQKKVLDQIVNQQKDRLDQAVSDAKTWADEQAAAYASAQDGISSALQDLINDQNSLFTSMLDPLNNFNDQTGVSLEEMMTNLQKNNEALMNWQGDLLYLMQTGNEDIAAYFAQIGPMGIQAMSELINGTPQQMQEFRDKMTTGFELAGTDAQAALEDGLKLIPGLASQAGIDVNDMLEQEMKNAQAPADALDEAYKTAFNRIARNSKGVIADAFGELGTTSETTKAQIDKLFDAIQLIDPAKLFQAGVTDSEALSKLLGIPDVARKLAELQQQGLDDPINIASNITDVLTDLDFTQEQIDALINPSNEIDIVLNEAKKMAALDDLNTLQTKLDALGKTVTINLAFKINGLNGYIDLLPQLGDVGYTKAADGGVLPGNARIQSPGTLVQWAEPETGGEAFIPMSPSKRSQSMKIWAEVGKQFGIFKAFGNGGINEPGGGYPNAVAPPNKPGTYKFGSGSSSKSSGKAKSGGGGGGAFFPSMELLERLNEVGDLSNADFLAALNNTLPTLTKYSDEWYNVYQMQQDVMDRIKTEAEDAAKEAEKQAKEMLDHQQMIEDNMYKSGAMGTDQYLDVLNARLAGLEKFSDDWFNTWSEIQNIQDEATKEMEKQQKESTDFMKKLQDTMTDALSAIADPFKQATSLFSAFGQDQMVTFDQIRGFYDHMAEASDRWEAVLAKLKGMGLNDEMFNQNVAAGPQALGYAEALASGGKSGIDYINSQNASLNDSAYSIAGQYAPGGSVTNNEITIGDVTFEIPASVLAQMNGAISPEMVKAWIQSSMQSLAEQIRTGVQ